MNQKDIIWQNAIDAETRNVMKLPSEELFTLQHFSSCSVELEGIIVCYGLWHEGPEQRNVEIHSFILMGERKLFLGFYRKYLAGFSVTPSGEIVSIPDEILLSYD
ncbi:hypothetical protein EON80_07865 [bacterium]|nr:MAG: hypothetical protein EON80_07865 [bacterium]